jgi:zinc-binding alcohol dehydrogenase family protein
MPEPVVAGRDILVEVKAVSVNPVDTKIRRSAKPSNLDEWKILGWDASGIVKAVGSDVVNFKPGDEVWYAGSIARTGSNAQFQLVDERIVGLKPKSIDFVSAAALPLTSLTAWEMLFDRLEVPKRGAISGKKSILIIGAAGGVGSIMIQLARKLTDLEIIATASRAESVDWVKSLGAHHVIDHKKTFNEQLNNVGIPNPDYVVSLTNTNDYFEQISEVIKPQGKFGLIDDPETPIDVMKLKRKSISLHWELMFTRSLYETADMHIQGEILSNVAKLVDDGTVKSTISNDFGLINAENLLKAHELIEAGEARGKIVLAGF